MTQFCDIRHHKHCQKLSCFPFLLFLSPIQNVCSFNDYPPMVRSRQKQLEPLNFGRNRPMISLFSCFLFLEPGHRLDLRVPKKVQVFKSFYQFEEDNSMTRTMSRTGDRRTIRISGKQKFEVSRNYNCVAGIDTDLQYLVVCVLDRDSVMVETEEFQQTHDGHMSLVDYLLNEGVEFVAIESTATYHIPAYNAMKAAGINVGVINPQLISALIRASGKTDAADAFTIAKLALQFRLNTSNMPTDEQLPIRVALRESDKKKHIRTQVTNRAAQMFNLVNFMLFQHLRISSPSGRAILLRLANGVSAHKAISQGWLGARNKEAKIAELCEIVQDEPLPDWLQDLAKGWVKEIDYTTATIEQLEDFAVKRAIETYPSQVNLLTTIPQISVSLAVRLIAEMGPDFHLRYDSPKAFARALGVAPRHHITGGSIKEKQINRTGNSFAKRHLFLAVSAFYARSKDKDRDRLNAFIQRYRDRGGAYRAAIMAGCNKLARYIYVMMQTGEYYRPYTKHLELENDKNGQNSHNA